ATPTTSANTIVPADELTDWWRLTGLVCSRLSEHLDDRLEEYLYSQAPAYRELPLLERALHHLRLEMAETLKANGLLLSGLDSPEADEAGSERKAELGLVLGLATDPYQLNLPRSHFDVDRTLGETLE